MNSKQSYRDLCSVVILVSLIGQGSLLAAERTGSSTIARAGLLGVWSHQEGGGTGRGPGQPEPEAGPGDWEAPRMQDGTGSKGFRGRVRSVDAVRKAMVLEAKIAAYADSTTVSVVASSLKDEDGAPVAFTDLHRGDEVFVEYQGGFLESLPLQLMGKAPCIVIQPHRDGRISRIAKFGHLGETWVIIGEGREQLIVHAGRETKMPSRELKVGDEIVARYSGMTLESMPPRIDALAIALKQRAQTAGFEARVLEAREFSGRLNLVIEANLPSYGVTKVSAGVSELVDASGKPLPNTAAKPGAKVFVEYSGGFLESYPLQMQSSVRVVVKSGATPAAPARRPGFEALIESADVEGGKLSLRVRGTIAAYGSIMVMLGVGELVDAEGKPVPHSQARPGARIFVEYDGGFLESLPLQLMSKPRVVLLQ